MNNNLRVLFLVSTNSYRAPEFLSASRKLGLEATVASQEPNPLEKTNPSGFLTLNFRNVQASVRRSLDFARYHPVHGVVGTDDETVFLASHISRALSLPHNPASSVSAAWNKHEMRKRLNGNGATAPEYGLYPLEEKTEKYIHEIHFPCVVKPLILSGSRGVIRADNEKDFIMARQRLKTILKTPSVQEKGDAAEQMLVESFIPGFEVALEGLLINGELHLLALFDKPDPLNGPFFEETIYVTPSRLPAHVQEEIVSCASSAVKTLGIHSGPVHAEIRTNAKGPRVVEIAARSIGGKCSRVLEFGAGVTLEELILRQAFSKAIFSYFDNYQNMRPYESACGVMMIPVPAKGILEKVTGRNRALEVPGITEIIISAHPGEELVPLPEGSRYPGFIFARGETPDFVETALRKAHACLKWNLA